ncbi:hypothetical protein C8R47DRAFT_1268201 [Mycena vitilis]|nr:hypothetical protein C8R47DRAFT_1268201 [Mycena vitilis]
MDQNCEPTYPNSAYTNGAGGGLHPLYPGDDGRGFQADFPQQSSSYGQEGYYHPFAHPRPQYQQPMITREQNYPSLLAEMQNTMATMQAQIAATELEAKAAKAAALQVQEAHTRKEAETRKGALQGKAKLSKTQGLVQSKMRWVLGIRVLDADNKLVWKLPLPLAPGQKADLLADNKTERAHPNWLSGTSDPHNLSICLRVRDLAMDQIKRDNLLPDPSYGSPTEQQVLTVTKNFYKNLRKTFTSQTTEEGRLRREVKCGKSKHRGRRVEKAKEHRATVPKLREIYGEAKTVGDYEVIHTTDMSSEHSDCGMVNQTVFNAHRKRSGGGERGWEIRRKNFRSSWLNLYLAHLKTLRRAMLAEAQAEPGASSSSNVGHRVPRFKGMVENEDNAAPSLTRKGPLYQSMVSEAWMKKNNTTYPEIRALPDPDHFTVFQLPLRAADLHENEIEYLGDDELA